MHVEHVVQADDELTAQLLEPSLPRAAGVVVLVSRYFRTYSSPLLGEQGHGRRATAQEALDHESVLQVITAPGVTGSTRLAFRSGQLFLDVLKQAEIDHRTHASVRRDGCSVTIPRARSHSVNNGRELRPSGRAGSERVPAYSRPVHDLRTGDTRWHLEKTSAPR